MERSQKFNQSNKLYLQSSIGSDSWIATSHSCDGMMKKKKKKATLMWMNSGQPIIQATTKNFQVLW